MMKNRWLLFLLLTVFYLTGCWNANEIDKLYYVYTFGIDYVDGQYETYVQMINLTATGAEETPGDTKGSVGRSRGKTVSSAVHNLYKSTPLNTYWGHLSVIIVTKQIFEMKKTEEVLDSLMRLNFTRYTPWVYTTDEPIDKLLTTFPFFDESIAYTLYGDPKKDYEQSSIVVPKRLHRYIPSLSEPSRTTIIPHLSIKSGLWRETKPMDSISISGASLAKGNHYKGVMENNELSGLIWLNKETKRAPLPILKKGEPIATIIIDDVKSKITPVITSDNKIEFNIDTKLSGNILEFHKQIPFSKLKQLAIDTIKRDIMTTYKKALELDADIYQLADSLYRKDPKLFKKVTTNDELQLTKDSIKNISVSITIRHSGKKKFPNNLRKT